MISAIRKYIENDLENDLWCTSWQALVNTTDAMNNTQQHLQVWIIFVKNERRINEKYVRCLCLMLISLKASVYEYIVICDLWHLKCKVN